MKKSIFVKIILMVAMLIFILKPTAYADVGDFETYSSDSSSSSWSSDDSWSSSSDDWGTSWSSRDYDSGYYSGSRRSSSESDKYVYLFIFIIIVAVVIFSRFNSHSQNTNYQPRSITTPPNNENDVLDKIKQIDPKFDQDEFSSWVRDLFVKLQYAWSDRDWSVIRCFETPELFEQHSAQLQRYIQNKQINKMERVSVNSVKYLSFEQSGDKEVL